MEKTTYARTSLKITVFDTEDVIQTSAGSQSQSSKLAPIEIANNGLSLLPKVNPNS